MASDIRVALADFAAQAKRAGIEPYHGTDLYAFVGYTKDRSVVHYLLIDRDGSITDSDSSRQYHSPEVMRRILARYERVEEAEAERLFHQAKDAALRGEPTITDLSY